MRISKKLLILMIIGGPFMAHAQKPLPHSLAVGLQNAVAKVSYLELNASSVSIDLNHQRNVNGFFSWRTGLMLTYVFPVEFQRILPTTGTFIGASQRTSISYFHAGLSTIPMIYHRDDNFSVFVGLGGGVGLQLENRKTFSTNKAGGVERRLGNRLNPYLTLGWKPVIGTSFNLGDSRSGNEMEFTLSRESWWTVFEGEGADPFFWYGLEITYRHNFKQG